MKKQTLAACFIAAIALSMNSCDWFGNNKHYINTKTILGKWQITSIQRNTLTTAEDDPIEGLLFSKPAYNDSIQVIIEFDADSTYTMYANNSQKMGSNKYYVDSATQRLFVKEASITSSFAIKALADTVMQIVFNNGNTKYNIKKQQ